MKNFTRYRFMRFTGPALLIAAIGSTGCLVEDDDSKPGSNGPDMTPDWVVGDFNGRPLQDEVFYFVMPDRFYNGDTNNDYGAPSGLSHGGFDPTDYGMFHGGDMRGLEQKLDYLEEMGVTAIWMTPILRNKAVQGDSAGYHGYWTLDFTEIDPHFGTNDDLRSLRDAAHSRNIKIFFDIITNHTADVIKYEECHAPDGSALPGFESGCPYKSLADVASGDTYTPFIPEGEADAKTPAWLNDPQWYHNQGDSTWAGESAVYGDFVGLDDLATSDPFVIDGMIDIFKDIVTDFRPDGFRIDTVKHVHTEFWQAFTPVIMEHARVTENIPHFTMFGEVYSGDPAELAYYTTVAGLPSVLDFGFQAAMSGAVISGDGTAQPLYDLFAQDDRYANGTTDANELLNFTGNHDMGRFGYFLQSAHSGMSDAEQVKRSRLAHALMYFARGVPVIYYGDEQGFTGQGGDKAARENMFPSQVASYNANNLMGTDATTAEYNFDQQHPLYQAFRQLGKLYHDHPALRRGEQFLREPLDADDMIFAVSRVLDGEHYLVVFNLATTTRTAAFATDTVAYESVYGATGLSVTDAAVSVQIPALDFVIVKAATDLPTTPAPVIAGTSGVENGSFVSGLLQWVIDLDGIEDRVLPQYEVVFELTVDGTTQVIAQDRNPPYQLFWNTVNVADGSDITLHATVTNPAGESASVETTVAVENRPIEVNLTYANPNGMEHMILIDGQGGTRTLTDNDPSAIGFQQSISVTTGSETLLTFVRADKSQLQRPMRLSRQDLLALATDNDGALVASVALDTDLGYATQLLTLDPALDAPLSYADIGVRGSVNGWGHTPMTFQGNGVYSTSLLVQQGEHDYKFADPAWGVLNMGSPVTERGLVVGSNPGNLGQAFRPTNLYDFTLYRAFDTDDQMYLLHQLERDLGPFGEEIYLRGSMNDWADTDVLRYVAVDEYTLSVELPAGGYEFKLASGDWSTELTLPEDTVVELGSEYTLVPGGFGSASINYTVPEDEDAVYHFTVTHAAGQYSLSIEQGNRLGADIPPYAEAPYLRGDHNGWDADYSFAYVGNNRYSGLWLFNDLSTDFKIAAADWSSPNLGAADSGAVTPGTPLVLAEGSNTNVSLTVGSAPVVVHGRLNASNLDAPQLTVDVYDDYLVVHYVRADAEYTDWGLYTWSDQGAIATGFTPSWAEPLLFYGRSGDAAYTLLPLADANAELGLIVKLGDAKNCADDLFFTPGEHRAIWMVAGVDGCNIYLDEDLTVIAE